MHACVMGEALYVRVYNGEQNFTIFSLVTIFKPGQFET